MHTLLNPYEDIAVDLRLRSGSDKFNQVADSTHSYHSVVERSRNERRRLKVGWLEKTLLDIGINIDKGQMITSSEVVRGNIPVIAGGKQPAYFHNKPNRNGTTITISGSGANAGFVNIHKTPIFASDCSTISESDNYDIYFIYYSLLSKQNEIYNAQTGGAQPYIHPKDLQPLKIGIPLDTKHQKKETEVKSISTIQTDINKQFSLEIPFDPL